MTFTEVMDHVAQAFETVGAAPTWQNVAVLGPLVLIRTFLPDRLSYFDRFPGIERALERVPGLDVFAARFEPHGFAVRHVEHVPDIQTTPREAADWVERMRHADSLLTALTDDEVAEGVRRLRAAPDERAALEISLVVLGR